MHSSVHDVRNRPKTVASNFGINQQGGVSKNRYSGQIIPRPKNDGLKPRTGENYRNDIMDGNVLNNESLNKRGRGTSTLSKPQKILQSLGSKNPSNNSGFLSR